MKRPVVFMNRKEALVTRKIRIPDHGEMVCCACNCTSFRACQRSVDGVEVEICQWTWRDSALRVGLCSFCAGRLANPTFPVPRQVKDLARQFRRLLAEAAVLDGRLASAALDARKIEMAIDSGRIRE